MLGGSERDAAALRGELQDTADFLELEGDGEGVLFLQVLRALLRHQAPRAVERLGGPYLRAFNRICNQVGRCPPLASCCLKEDGSVFVQRD